MTLHVAAQSWYSFDVRSFDWQILNLYDGGLVRWAVPVFVMISGALFLNPDKNIPVKKLYTKYILRIITVFLFWSFIYACTDYFTGRSDIAGAFRNFLSGHYHLWFLYMITGLYMIVPLVRRIAESESSTKYFLVFALIFTSILPECSEILSLFSEKYGSFAGKFINKFYMNFVGGFTVYFLLGHFLNQADITQKTERMIYLAGLCGFMATILLSAYASILTGKPNGTFYSGLKFNLNTICESSAVFVFFRKHFNRENTAVRKLSQYSFGAYLVHAGVIPVVRKIGLHPLTFSPVISVPVIAVIVFVISFGISAVLNHIPVLKKYIV